MVGGWGSAAPHPAFFYLRHCSGELLPGAAPVRQAPYSLKPQKREQIRKEVDYLLEHGLPIPRSSPWASPCLLVAKEESQLRFCTDYRKANAATGPDTDLCLEWMT